jgi:hypothetical protein
VTHFTDEELRRWSASGPGEARTRVHEHLRECAACATRFADAVRAHPIETGETASDVDEFVAAGYASATRGPGTVLRFPIRRRVMLTAAAAALLAAIVIPPILRSGGVPAGPRFRGTGIVTLAPDGAVTRDATFEWSSGLAAARFRLEVGDASGVVYTAETAASRLVMPAALGARLRPGVDYWWTVTALDSGGNPITSSPRRTFAIRPD